MKPHQTCKEETKMENQIIKLLDTIEAAVGEERLNEDDKDYLNEWRMRFGL